MLNESASASCSMVSFTRVLSYVILECLCVGIGIQFLKLIIVTQIDKLNEVICILNIGKCSYSHVVKNKLHEYQV